MDVCISGFHSAIEPRGDIEAVLPMCASNYRVSVH